jgi:simple sugar transport system ATP-binding protein
MGPASVGTIAHHTKPVNRESAPFYLISEGELGRKGARGLKFCGNVATLTPEREESIVLTTKSPAVAEVGGEPVIRARGLTKTFGHVVALEDVDLEIRHGEVVALLGDNGAGKSTLTKCLCGVYAPDAGELEFSGRPVRLDSIRDAEAYGISVVYQDLALAPDLSVLENVFLGHEIVRGGWLGRLRVLSRVAMAKQTDTALQELGINLPSVRVPVGDLSGGQRQAVAVARAAMWTKEAILMDEPTAALGTRQSDIVCDLITSTAQRGLGVLVISHDLPRVLEIASRAIVLRHGRVVLNAAAGEVSRREIIDAMVGYQESS